MKSLNLADCVFNFGLIVLGDNRKTTGKITKKE